MIIYFFSETEKQERLAEPPTEQGVDMGYATYCVDRVLFHATSRILLDDPWKDMPIDKVPSGDVLSAIKRKFTCCADAVVVELGQYNEKPVIDCFGQSLPIGALRRFGLPDVLTDSVQESLLRSTKLGAKAMYALYGYNEGRVHAYADVSDWIEAARRADLFALKLMFQENAGLADQKLNGLTGKDVAWAEQYDATQVGSQIDPKDLKNLQETVAFLNACAARSKP
jgi:hypothetical protein